MPFGGGLGAFFLLPNGTAPTFGVATDETLPSLSVPLLSLFIGELVLSGVFLRSRFLL